jgi:hypothetical protein
MTVDDAPRYDLRQLASLMAVPTDDLAVLVEQLAKGEVPARAITAMRVDAVVSPPRVAASES